MKLFSLLLSFILLSAGCSSLPKASLTIPVRMLEHAKNGATSLEVEVYSLTAADKKFLQNYQVCTNTYVSCGQVIEFVEIKW